MSSSIEINGSRQATCCCPVPRAYSLGWIFAFLVNILIGFTLYIFDISILKQFKDVASDASLSDLSDFLLKFSIIYLLTRYQLGLKTFSDSPAGQSMAWIVSILVNLVVGDLLTVLIWHPFTVLLTNAAKSMAVYMDRNARPTYIMMGLSQYFTLMAANHLKFAVAFYFLYRCMKSLVVSPHSPAGKQPSRALSSNVEADYGRCIPNQISGRNVNRSRLRSRRSINH